MSRAGRDPGSLDLAARTLALRHQASKVDRKVCRHIKKLKTNRHMVKLKKNIDEESVNTK